MKVYIGVDVGGTAVKMGMFAYNGDLLHKWSITTNQESNGDYILPDVAISIREELKEKDFTLSQVAGVGLGIPGPVMPDGFVAVCVNLGWKNVNPTNVLSKLLDGVTVKAGNDANVAALGEMWQGGGKGSENVTMVTLGTGVGGGIIVDGQMVAGVHGMGGEIGHFLVNTQETATCNCGNKGCLEQYSSATGIVRTAKKALTDSDHATILREVENLTAKDVLDAAKSGDQLAYDVVSRSMKTLAVVLSYISMTVDPEVFVIGGGVSYAGEFLRSMIEEYLNGYIYISPQKPKVVLASLGNDAGIYGAARMIMEK